MYWLKKDKRIFSLESYQLDFQINYLARLKNNISRLIKWWVPSSFAIRLVYMQECTIFFIVLTKFKTRRGWVLTKIDSSNTRQLKFTINYGSGGWRYSQRPIAANIIVFLVKWWFCYCDTFRGTITAHTAILIKLYAARLTIFFLIKF